MSTPMHGFIVPPQRFYAHTIHGVLEAPVDGTSKAYAALYALLLAEATRCHGMEHAMGISHLAMVTDTFTSAAAYLTEQLQVLRFGERRVLRRDEDGIEWWSPEDPDDDDDEEDETIRPLRDLELEAQGQLMLPFPGVPPHMTGR